MGLVVACLFTLHSESVCVRGSNPRVRMHAHAEATLQGSRTLRSTCLLLEEAQVMRGDARPGRGDADCPAARQHARRHDCRQSGSRRRHYWRPPCGNWSLLLHSEDHHRTRALNGRAVEPRLCAGARGHPPPLPPHEKVPRMLVLLHAHAVALTPCRCPQIFATTRKEDAADDGGKRKAGSAPKSGGGGGAGPAKKFKPYSKKMQDAAELEKQQFRDRAKERRLGTSKEYQISEETVRSLTVEESKYLGGDMEHTHLVKGLDFALLAKVRSEMDMKEEKRDEQLDKALEDALTKLEATTLLGKSVRNMVLTERRSGRKSIDMFLPGRTTFAFDLDDDFGSEIPTAVSRCGASLTP